MTVEPTLPPSNWASATTLKGLKEEAEKVWSLFDDAAGLRSGDNKAIQLRKEEAGEKISDKINVVIWHHASLSPVDVPVAAPAASVPRVQPPQGVLQLLWPMYKEYARVQLPRFNDYPQFKLNKNMLKHIDLQNVDSLSEV